jgi:hypothetical protein
LHVNEFNQLAGFGVPDHDKMDSDAPRWNQIIHHRHYPGALFKTRSGASQQPEPLI